MGEKEWGCAGLGAMRRGERGWRRWSGGGEDRRGGRAECRVWRRF